MSILIGSVIDIFAAVDYSLVGICSRRGRTRNLNVVPVLIIKFGDLSGIFLLTSYFDF